MVLRRRFEAIDTNKDGFITADEMENFSRGLMENQFESMMGRSMNWREFFSILDPNNDGKISYAEFLAGASNKADLLNEERLCMAFDVLDRDGDGMVSTEDIRWRFTYDNLKGNPELDMKEEFW